MTDGKLLIGRTTADVNGSHITAANLTPGSGISITNGAGSITIAASPPATSLTITGDTGGALSPTANNWNILGQQAGTVAVMDTVGTAPSTLRVEDRTWITPLVVDPSSTVGLRGTYQTIAAAIAAASAGQTIVVRPGTYTEDITVDKNLNFQGFAPELRVRNPTAEIKGTITVSGSSLRVGFFGFKFTTNSAVSFTLSGNDSTVTCQNCFFDATNANSIAITGNGGTNFFIENCSGSLASTFTLFTTTNGLVWIKNSMFQDAAGTLAASTTSTGAVHLIDSIFHFPFATTSTGLILARRCQFGPIESPNVNQTWLTTAGTVTSYLEHCILYSGTASCISIGSGTTVQTLLCVLNSTNTNPITGAGTSKQIGNIFANTGVLDNTTTKTGMTAWTPVLNFGGGTTGITYSSQVGSYVRLGNVVFFNMEIILTNKGSSTGLAAITGLPITSHQATIHAISANALTFTGQVNARIAGGSTTISLDSFATTGARANLSDTAFANTTFIQVTGSYIAST
jgi:hypothetical protein